MKLQLKEKNKIEGDLKFLDALKYIGLGIKNVNLNWLIRILCLIALLFTFIVISFFFDNKPQSFGETIVYILLFFLVFFIIEFLVIITRSSNILFRTMKFIILNTFITATYLQFVSDEYHNVCVSIYSSLITLFIILFCLRVPLSRSTKHSKSYISWIFNVIYLTFVLMIYIYFFIDEGLVIWYFLPLLNSLFCIMYVEKDKKVIIDWNITMNVFKPGFYKQFNEKFSKSIFERTDIDGNYIFIDQDLEILNAIEQEIKDFSKKSEIGTLLKLDSFSKKKILYVKKYKEVYRLQIAINKTLDREFYMKSVTCFRYAKYYSKFLSLVFTLSKTINGKKIISENEYLYNLVQCNVFFDKDICKAFEKLDFDNKFKNWVLINGVYGAGKTSYVTNLCNMQNYEIVSHSFASSKYKDIISEIHMSFRKVFTSSVILGTSILLVSLVPLLTLIHSVVKGTKRIVFDSYILDRINLIDVAKLADVYDLGFGLGDAVIILTIAFILIILINRDIFHTFNFGTDKKAKYTIEAIAKKQKSNQRVIVEDIDRLNSFEEIYDVLLELSYLYTLKKTDFVGYISYDENVVKKKYARYLFSLGENNCNCQLEKPCRSNNKACINIKFCDYYQLIEKNYVCVDDLDFTKLIESYKKVIKEIVDEEIFKSIKDCYSFRELKSRLIEKLKNNVD